MEKSLQIRPRKRKQYSSSLKPTFPNPFMGIFTRSKSQVHVHKNRSGRTWIDTPSNKLSGDGRLLLNSTLKKPKRVHSGMLENGAAMKLSIKDLRARARRVFSPTSAVVQEENGNYGMGFDFEGEKCNGSSKVLENFGDLEFRFKGLDPDLGSGPRFGVADQNEEKNENRESVDPEPEDPEPGMGSHEPKVDDLPLNKKTSPVKEKNGVNKVSSSGTVLNSVSRRKVFKTPSSFSYRRMLPFLMEMAKEDSDASRIEIVGTEFSCKVQNSSNVDYKVSSILMDIGKAKTEDSGEHISDSKPLGKIDIKNAENNLHVKNLALHDANEKFPQAEENVDPFVEVISNENDLAIGDELIEGCVQTTLMDTENAKIEDSGEHIDDSKSLDNGDVKKYENDLHVMNQELHYLNKKLPQAEANVGPFAEVISNENVLARGNDLIEDHVQTTLMDTENANSEDSCEHIDDNISLDKGNSKKSKNNLRVKNQEPHHLDKKLPQAEENVGPFIEVISDENGLARGDDLSEDHVQTTPPDATVFSEIHSHDARETGEMNILRTGNHILGQPANGSTCSYQPFLHKKSCRSPRRIDTISVTKMILNPCSRSKIFKTSSSFSYRRLLPLLMDVANSSTNINQSSNIQKNLENNQHLPLLDSADKDAFMDKNEVHHFLEKEAKNHAPNIPTAVMVDASHGSSDKVFQDISVPFSSSVSSSEKSDLSISGNTSPCDIPNCMPAESSSSYAHVQLNKPKELEVVLPLADFRICDDEANHTTETSCCTIKDDSLPKESLLEISQHEQVDNEKNSLAECLDINNSITDKSRIEVFPPQGTDASVKGILKRNPRGCRGLCKCLNCASFRLHAERAFEFSKNQMLDAQEVALALIDELAGLRNILEKSAADGSNLGTFQLSKVQVRELCQRALETEQQAKQCLGQMNDNLNVHCRVPPLQTSTVTFSRHVEEKSIPSREL